MTFGGLFYNTQSVLISTIGLKARIIGTVVIHTMSAYRDVPHLLRHRLNHRIKLIGTIYADSERLPLRATGSINNITTSQSTQNAETSSRYHSTGTTAKHLPRPGAYNSTHTSSNILGRAGRLNGHIPSRNYSSRKSLSAVPNLIGRHVIIIRHRSTGRGEQSTTKHHRHKNVFLVHIFWFIVEI